MSWAACKHAFRFELAVLAIHTANLVSNLLGQDVLSRALRRTVLRLLGVRIGRGSVIDGGGYVYGGGLTIGRHCVINRNCYFDLTAEVILEDNVEIGHGVTFVTASHEVGQAQRRAGPVGGKPIFVGSGAWIGANATVLPGVRIGRGAVVSACSLVAGDVADNRVVGGVPARPMRDLNAPGLAAP